MLNRSALPVLLLLACSQPLGAQATTAADVRRAMREEIEKLALTCVTNINTAGYNKDGKTNFLSFIDNNLTGAQLTSYGTVIFDLKAIPGMESTLEIELTPDEAGIESFHIYSEKVTITEVRVGKLTAPRFEKRESRVKTFDMECDATPR